MSLRLIMSMSIATFMLIQSGFSYAENGLVIRFGPCTAEAFMAAGTDAGDGNVKNLSVNCTTETSEKSQFNMYTTGIGGHEEYCVATIEKLESEDIVITPDADSNDPLNCLVEGDVKIIAEFLKTYSGM